MKPKHNAKRKKTPKTKVTREGIPRKTAQGRDLKLADDGVRLAILNGIKNGMPNKFACMRAGISAATFYEWLERSTQEGADQIFLDFADAVKKAEADNVAYHAAIIQKAGAKNWTASAWWLERTHPKEFGKMERLEHSGIGGGPIRYANLSDEELDARFRALVERNADAHES